MSMRDRINALKTDMGEGVQIVTAPQLFPTPQHIAEKMVNYLNIEQGDRVLEPSAGTGNLLKLLSKVINFEDGNIQAIEINQKLCNDLKNKYSGLVVTQRDFLQLHPIGEPDLFDCIIMNPPFKNGEDIKHIKHALNFLDDGGTLVALCANGSRQRAQLMDLCDHWEDLPYGTFKEQGTMVDSALLVISK